ncbi:MAG: RNA polymerase sigma factor [Oscillospiraceae bacterium]|nr:RNA polymerase sigma factor [Oscillospiraceae bacterium]
MLGICLALIDEPSDKEKFERLYFTYKDMMEKIALSILHNKALADETVQDCMFKLVETITDIPDVPSKRAKAMIVIMVKNKARNNLELEHYDDVVPYEDDDFISDRLSDNIATALGYKNILQEIKELDPVYRDVLIYKYIHGFTASNISEILEIPIRTVETRVFRGRKILKERLEGIYDEYGDKK